MFACVCATGCEQSLFTVDIAQFEISSAEFETEWRQGRRGQPQRRVRLGPAPDLCLVSRVAVPVGWPATTASRAPGNERDRASP